VPIIECVARTDGPLLIAYFGYQNDLESPLELLVGVRNYFLPAPFERGQTTTFLPGRSPAYPNAAFSVVFSGDRLVWFLNGHTVIANRDSPACEKPTEVP
jgi:hypothetical protein